jgi:hypothetical protein
MIQGSPKFNGLAVVKFSIDYLRNPVHIEVEAAFVSQETGDTHGWTRGAPAWSDETRKLINLLRSQLELDLAARHFVGATTSNGSTSAPVGDKPTGLGELFGNPEDDGVPSV